MNDYVETPVPQWKALLHYCWHRVFGHPKPFVKQSGLYVDQNTNYGGWSYTCSQCQSSWSAPAEIVHVALPGKKPAAMPETLEEALANAGFEVED